MSILKKESKDETSQKLVNTAQSLIDLALSKGTAGNISARQNNRILITPSGIVPEKMQPADIVTINVEGKILEGSLKPSSEWPMHTAIYRQREDVKAIVHCHSSFATSIACTGQRIPAFHYMVAVAGGIDIPCTHYELFGSNELAKSAAQALTDRNACLLANHGQLAIGQSLKHALDLAVEVEELAKQYWATLQLGGPKLLSEQEMAEVLKKFRTYRKQNKG